MAGIGSDNERVEETRKDEDKTRMGHGVVARKRTQMNEEKLSHGYLLFNKAGRRNFII